MTNFIRNLLFPVHRAEEVLIREVCKSAPYSAVGVKEMRNSHGAAIRIFYPASAEGKVRTSLFRNPLAFVVEGSFSRCFEV
jgi:hypothetical protein